MARIACAPGSRNFSISAAVKGKCRKCTDEVLPSALVRSTSSGRHDGGDAQAADLDIDVVLDAGEAAEFPVAADLVVDLEHQRRDQFRAVGDQRIIGVEFVGDLFGAAALDMQHLMHLMEHGRVVLEIERRIGTDRDAAGALQLGDAGAAFLALPRIGFVRQNVGRCDRVRGHIVVLR